MDNRFNIITSDIKQVSDYTRLSFQEVENLAYYKFMLYRRDAWLWKQKSSEEGRQFLKTLKSLTTTTADYKAIKKYQMKGGI